MTITLENKIRALRNDAEEMSLQIWVKSMHLAHIKYTALSKICSLSQENAPREMVQRIHFLENDAILSDGEKKILQDQKNVLLEIDRPLKKWQRIEYQCIVFHRIFKAFQRVDHTPEEKETTLLRIERLFSALKTQMKLLKMGEKIEEMGDWEIKKMVRNAIDVVEMADDMINHSINYVFDSVIWDIAETCAKTIFISNWEDDFSGEGGILSKILRNPRDDRFDKWSKILQRRGHDPSEYLFYIVNFSE